MSFLHQLTHPIFVNLAKDVISFSSTCSLLAFVSGSTAENLKDLKSLNIQQFKMELPGLFSEPHEKQHNHTPHHTQETILNWGPQPLGVLTAWETLGFACMRLGTVKRVLLAQQLERYHDKQEALQLAPKLWRAQAAAQSGMESFAVNWAQSASSWSKLNMEGTSVGSDLGGWEQSEICATFLKHHTYYSTSPEPETAIFRTQKEVRDRW